VALSEANPSEINSCWTKISGGLIHSLKSVHPIASAPIIVLVHGLVIFQPPRSGSQPYVCARSA
jgi:hypothetical protein